MFDIVFTIGQAASALLLAYGGFLVLMPARKAEPNPRLEDEFLLRKHVLSDL